MSFNFQRNNFPFPFLLMKVRSLSTTYARTSIQVTNIRVFEICQFFKFETYRKMLMDWMKRLSILTLFHSNCSNSQISIKDYNEWDTFSLIFYIIRLTIVITKVSRHHPHFYCFCLKCNYDAGILNKCELWIVACCLIQGNGTTNLKALIRVLNSAQYRNPSFPFSKDCVFPKV